MADCHLLPLGVLVSRIRPLRLIDREEFSLGSLGLCRSRNSIPFLNMNRRQEEEAIFHINILSFLLKPPTLPFPSFLSLLTVVLLQGLENGGEVWGRGMVFDKQ